MIHITPNHDYSTVPLISIASIFMSIFSLSYILTEQATTNTGQYKRKYFGEVMLYTPCSEEAFFRVCVLLFFYTDTLLRVTALSIFVNVDSFQPWNWIAVAFLFPIYILYQWTDHTFIEAVIEGFVSIFANDPLLEFEYGQHHNTGQKLQQMMFNMVVILGFIMASLFVQRQADTTIFWMIGGVLIFNFLLMVPSVWYMYFRKELTEKWNKNDIQEEQCQCNAEQPDNIATV